MKQYEVRFFDPSAGRAAVLRVEAASLAAVQEAWSVSAPVGSVFLGVVDAAGRKLGTKRSKAGRAGAPSNVASRVGRRSGDFHVEWWCRELRTLLLAGMTVVEALETLQAQTPGDARASVHADLIAALRSGQSLSKAMTASDVFPRVLVAGVTASERTSTLPSALDDFLKYASLLERLKKQVISAAIYPSVVLGMGGLIALFLVLYVVPRFSRMYADFRGTVSPVTGMLIWVSKLLHNDMAWVLTGLASLVALVIVAWRKGWIARLLADAAMGVPALAQQWNNFRLAKLYQSLALMTRGGYALDEAVQICEGLSLGGPLDEGLPQVRRSLLEGRAVSQAFGAAGLTEPVALRLLATGERTGNFDAVLQTIADRYADTFSMFVERATRIVEPVLLLIVALVVGGIVVMMYMPIFDMANGVR